MRRLKPVLFHCPQMKPRPQNLKSLQGRRFFRQKIKLAAKADINPVKFCPKISPLKFKPERAVLFRHASFAARAGKTAFSLLFQACKEMSFSLYLMGPEPYGILDSLCFRLSESGQPRHDSGNVFRSGTLPRLLYEKFRVPFQKPADIFLVLLR